MLAEAMIALLERLWPLWLLLIVLIGWRLWHLRALGEGDPESTAIERRRWKRALILCGIVFLVSFVGAMLDGRPHTGDYHPLEMQEDGSLKPAQLEPEAR